VASAETASTLPDGSTAAWVALGGGTFRQIRHATGEVYDLDRAAQLRLEGWYGVGLSDRLQLSASLPVVFNTVRIVDGNPCQTAAPIPDYCEPVVGLGRAILDLRRRWRLGATDGTLSVQGATDVWQAEVRDRWTSTGDGTWDLRVGGLLGREVGRVRLDGWLGFTLRTKRDLVVEQETLRVPANQVDGGLQVRWTGGPWAVEATADSLHRLGGLERDATWTEWARPTEERFSSLHYRDVAVRLAGSRALSGGWSLTARVGRVVWVRSGPPDRWDAVVGLSRFTSGGGRAPDR